MTGSQTGFMECDTCRSKPGSPELCAGCLHNRAVILEYEQRLKDIAATAKKRMKEIGASTEADAAEPVVPSHLAERVARGETMLLIFAFQERMQDWLRLNSIWCEKIGGVVRVMRIGTVFTFESTNAQLIAVCISGPGERRKLEGLIANYVWCDEDVDHETKQRALARAVPKNREE